MRNINLWAGLAAILIVVLFIVVISEPKNIFIPSNVQQLDEYFKNKYSSSTVTYKLAPIPVSADYYIDGEKVTFEMDENGRVFDDHQSSDIFKDLKAYLEELFPELNYSRFEWFVNGIRQKTNEYYSGNIESFLKQEDFNGKLYLQTQLEKYKSKEEQLDLVNSTYTVLNDVCPNAILYVALTDSLGNKIEFKQDSGGVDLVTSLDTYTEIMESITD